MRTSMKTLLAALCAGITVAACATEPYDYAYDDYGTPSYGYYGDQPGYYSYGPSVDFGPAYYYGRDYNGRDNYGRDYRGDHDGHWRHGDTDGSRGSTSQFNPAPLQCCGPGSGPGGSVTQRDADRWGAGG